MSRWAAWLLCVPSLAAFAAPAAETAPAYEDKLIEGGSLAPLEPDEAELASYNPAGMPRAWRVEGFASRIEQGDRIRHENGMVMSGRLDTPDYGAISLDATVRSGGSSSVFTLWQRGLAFDDGWRANTGLGMLNTPTINLARQQYRFYLPTFPIVGAATEWLQAGNVQLQASLGEPGLYSGLRVPGFSRLGGVVATGGAQVALAPEWQAGVQFADVRAVQTGSEANDAKSTGRSWYGTTAWQGTRDHVQFNLLDSQKNEGRHNLAWWMDAESRAGRFRHNYGVFRFDPEMSWGYASINSDVQGGYYRVNYQSQQWIWAAGVDSATSVTGRAPSGTYVTGNARYQADRSLGVGGGASARRAGGDAAAVYAFIDKQSAFGATRVQVDVLAAQGAQRTQQVAVDHAWPTQPGLRLSTSLSLGREAAADKRVTRASIAAFGGIDLTNNITLEGNLRFSQERETTRALGRYANVGLVWRIGPRWSLVATYYDNRAESQPFTGLAPLIPVDIAPVIPRDRAIFVTVRYEDHAGTPVAPLGGAPGAAGGTIAGYIFYDANDDGRRSAGESGAANLTVLLDGKFATRTDADGRFEFPMVASGRHTIVVVPDNLALPYSIANEGRNEVTVSTRQTATLEIAATRMR
jgi:hypothetical protein